MSLIPQVAGRRSQKKDWLGSHLHMSFSPKLESLGYPRSAALGGFGVKSLSLTLDSTEGIGPSNPP